MRVGVSGCLLGAKCNYDGNDLLSSFLKELEQIEEIEFANSESFLNIHISITNKILEDIRELTGKDIQTLNDIDIFLYVKDKKEFDEKTDKIMKDTDYVKIKENLI